MALTMNISAYRRQFSRDFRCSLDSEEDEARPGIYDHSQGRGAFQGGSPRPMQLFVRDDVMNDHQLRPFALIIRFIER